MKTNKQKMKEEKLFEKMTEKHEGNTLVNKEKKLGYIKQCLLLKTPLLIIKEHWNYEPFDVLNPSFQEV